MSRLNRPDSDCQAIMLKESSALIRFLLACVMLGVALGYAQLTAAAEQKIALVIGNSAYPSAPLRNPVNDAKAMAEKLRQLGFDVTLRTNATQKDINRAVVQFGQKLASGSVGLFYYAGHGLQVRGKNFLIPVDAEIESEASVRSESVDVDQVLDQFSASRLSMVILDACRNNPFERRFRASAGSGLAQIDAPKGTLIAYSTAPGKTAADGTGSNGIYTEELLKTLDRPGLKVEDVFKQVRINVAKVTQDQQIPWEASSLTGEFFFRPVTAKVPVEDQQLRQAERERAELLKSLEEERKKRDRDAELVRAEMEKLRAELLKLRDDSVPSRPTVQASAPVSATPTVAAPKPAGSPPEQRPQVAIASPAASSALATASPSAAEWAPRLALLEKSRGQLTLSKAVAVLLDLSTEQELRLLLTHEGDIKRKAWHNSYAIGTDHGGNLIWGGGYRLKNAVDAAQTALEQCVRGIGDFCKVIMINGEFREKDFLEMAKQLGGKNVDAVRQAYLRSLTKNPTESQVGFASVASAAGIELNFSFGYSSIRE